VTKVRGLTGLRGFASAIVALDHYVIIVNKAEADSLLFYLATFSGSFAVGLFFLVSGFVIPLSLGQTYSTEFLWRRLFRLYPVFIFCCLLKLFAQIASAPYMGGITPLLDFHTFRVFLANASMFGGLIYSLDQMIEPIVWTLAIEAKFYILSAIIFARWRRNPQAVFRAFVALTALLTLVGYYVTTPLAGWRMDLGMAVTAMPWMFCGLFASLLYIEKITRGDFYLGVACALSAFLLSPCRWFITLDKVLPSYALAALVFGYLLLRQGNVSFFNSKVLRFLGDISYPLYGIHSAVALIVAAFVTGGWLVQLAAFVSGVLFSGWVIHQAIEQPFIALGRKYQPPFANRGKVGVL
jgi:peptidoglycan/LPS O-acetylase OafA/YrhL